MEVPLSDGQVVLAEVTQQVDDVVAAGRGKDVVGRLPDILSSGLAPVTAFAADALATLRGLAEPPDMVSVEFGVTLSAKARLVIAESTGQAHLKFVMAWQRTPLHDDPSAR